MGIVGILLFLVQLPWQGLKLVGRLIGITDQPQIEFGPVRANKDDPRPEYHDWYDVICTNRKRSGLWGQLASTKDALNCRAELDLRPSAGDGKSLKGDALLVLGATSDIVGTLFVDRPTPIHVYYVATKEHPAHPLAPWTGLQEGGHYLSGAEFTFHDDMSARWLIPPGIYVVTVTVFWETRPFPYSFELAVPA